MKKAFLILVFLLFIQNILFGLEPAKSKLDALAAHFNLLDLNGNKVSLSDFKDKPLILFFWTTWCPFCRRALNFLKGFYPQLLKEGAELLAIDIGEPTYRVDNFAKRYSLPFNVLLDEDTAVADAYDILGVPTYILIDKKGYIVFKGNYFPRGTYKDLISQ
jgi:peroxiredoxin